MYKRLSAVMFPIMTVLLIGTAVWGYQENKEKNSILLKAENQYQRAFHDLSYHMDQLHTELGNTLAVNSASHGMHRKSLLNVWRLTSEAQNEVNQLPLTLLPFNHAEELLSRMSNFAYQTSIRDLSKEPLDEREMKNLKSLYENSKEISKDMQQVREKVLSNHLRWMDVETAMATENKSTDNTIIDGFKTVDKKVQEYPELDWGPSISSMYEKRSVKKLNALPITAQQVKEKSARFADVKPESVKVTENGKNTEWPSYTAKIDLGKGNAKSMDFTRNGGLLISYTYTREVGQKKAGREEAIEAGKQFLRNKEYGEMSPVAYDEYDNLANITFVPVKDNVFLYPEKVTVRTALDNGEVIGVQAADYVYEHSDKRIIPKAKLTIEQARKKLNPEFKESYHRMSLIKNEMSKQVLTHEFGGRINGSVYRIYLNADTGLEESIEVVKDSDEPNQRTDGI